MSEKRREKKLTAPELAAFSEEMANVLRAGISSMEGVTLLLEESDSPEERGILEDLQNTLMETGSLSRAIGDSGLFPDYYCQMAALGEETGRMDEVMKSLTEYYQREQSIRRAVRSAISYPLLMIVMMVVVIVMLITQVMPIFERVFLQLGSQMTGISGGLLSLGNALRNYSVVFLVMLLILVFVGIYLTRSVRGRLILLKCGYKIRGIRRIYQRIAGSRFAKGLAVALKSGMNTQQAMEMTIQLVDDPYFKQKLESCQSLVQEYAMLSTAIFESGIFPGLYGRMIKLSEKTGNLEEVLERVALSYGQEADREIDGIISVVEPTLVILLSVIVGVILLSVMLPLLGIMTGING